jgi:hypothetical protein
MANNLFASPPRPTQAQPASKRKMVLQPHQGNSSSLLFRNMSLTMASQDSPNVKLRRVYLALGTEPMNLMMKVSAPLLTCLHFADLIDYRSQNTQLPYYFKLLPCSPAEAYPFIARLCRCNSLLFLHPRWCFVSSRNARRIRPPRCESACSYAHTTKLRQSVSSRS